MGIAVMSWMFAIPLLGFVTGLRSMTAMAVLCWFAFHGDLPVDGTWAFWAAKRITMIVFIVLAAGELIGDKLPMIPNRTDALPLIARIFFGGLIGAICATSLGGRYIEAVFLGVIGAVAGAFLGFHCRQWLTRKIGAPDVFVAVAEDIFAVGASILAMRIVTG